MGCQALFKTAAQILALTTEPVEAWHNIITGNEVAGDRHNEHEITHILSKHEKKGTWL
jgi:hypothetical protein